MAERLVIRLKNQLPEIARLAELVERFGAQHGLAGSLLLNVNLCLDELITNTISYGYDDQEEHIIAVQVALDNGALKAVVEDDARAFNPLAVGLPDLEAPVDERAVGGLGVHFVRTLMDDVRYQRTASGNRIELTKRLEPAG